MLRVNPIKGGRDAITYYTELVREDDRDRTATITSAEASAPEDYYLASPDEGGRWWGQGAEALGLSGLGSRSELSALFEGHHPQTGEQLGQRLSDRTIRAYDLTFSAPKSVSLLSSLCGSQIEREVIAAHEAAVKATLNLLEERTSTRGGKGGYIRLETGGLSALLVRHRTSRALDPQLHTHALVIARVQGTDGRWRSLDASTAMRGALSFGSIYQSALRSELQLRFPGIRFGSVVKGQAEIEGFDELRAAFSKRSEQANREFDRLLGEWRSRHPDREPTLKQQALLRRQAALRSRGAKQHARSLAELKGDWETTAHSLGFDRARIEGLALARMPEPTALQSAEQVVDEAIQALAAERSVFSQSQIEREIACRIPCNAGLNAHQQARAIEELAGSAIRTLCIDLAAAGEQGHRGAQLLGNEPTLERYSTQGLLAEEQEICRQLEGAAAAGGSFATVQRMRLAARALRHAQPQAPLPDPEQVGIAALIAGDHRVCVVVGPAGSGKTTTLRMAAIALAQEQREVLVLCPWARGAAAVSDSTGLPAENVSRFLAEQKRGDQMRADLRLAPGSTLIIDEAGTLATEHWRAIHDVAAQQRLRLVFIGDDRQLSAVGRGGMFQAARERVPTAQLTRVHRFADEWEREASLALREGHAESLDRYQEHGRIFAGSAEQVHERMLADWHEAQREGRACAFSVPTRKQGAYLSSRAQELRLAAGELDTARELQTAQGQSLYVGDLVATRCNERRPSLVKGGPVRNRELWTVRAIGEDGSLALQRGKHGRSVVVAADYAHNYTELAYFSTVHGVQGRTVQQGGVLIDERSGFRSLYVGMTRGREQNLAYVVRDENSTTREVLERTLLRERADLGVLAQARSISELVRKRNQQLERSVGEGLEPARSSVSPSGWNAARVRDGKLVLGPDRDGRVANEQAQRGLGAAQRVGLREREEPGVGIEL